jgi:hypothetical protein
VKEFLNPLTHDVYDVASIFHTFAAVAVNLYRSYAYVGLVILNASLSSYGLERMEEEEVKVDIVKLLG